MFSGIDKRKKDVVMAGCTTNKSFSMHSLVPPNTGVEVGESRLLQAVSGKSTFIEVIRWGSEGILHFTPYLQSLYFNSARMERSPSLHDQERRQVREVSPSS